MKFFIKVYEYEFFNENLIIDKPMAGISRYSFSRYPRLFHKGDIYLKIYETNFMLIEMQMELCVFLIGIG